MRIKNIFAMNDWEMNKFLSVILTIQIVLISAIGLEYIGFNIPVIRELVGVIYLLFVPGIIILRILRIHKIGNIPTILYSLGLSITFLMLLGCIINFIYPFFGIKNPLSTINIFLSVFLFVILFCVICFLRDKSYSDPDFIELNGILPQSLFLCLIPFLTIFATYLFNFYNSNFLMIFLFLIISIIVILIGFDKVIPKKIYPLAIFVISISLLYHTSLITNYIFGYDIFNEYYSALITIKNSYWAFQDPGNNNAMLSSTILPSILVKVSGINLIWILKLIYPLIFSFVPLGLYQIARKFIENRLAFLSTFYFMAVYVFFTEMLQLAKQEIAELFFIILILLIISNKPNKMKKSILLIIFSLSLISSHYGLSYLFLIILVFVLILLFVIENPLFIKLTNKIFGACGLKFRNSEHISQRNLTLTFVLFFYVFALAWYTYASNSSILDTVTGIGQNIYFSISELFNHTYVQGLDKITSELGILHGINRQLYLITQIFLVFGFVSVLFKKQIKIGNEYLGLSAGAFLLLVLSITLPYFASALQTSRIFQISLLLLSPFFVIGCLQFLEIINKIFIKSSPKKYLKFTTQFISIFLVIFFLFNSALIYEVGGELTPSFAIRSLNSNVDYVYFNPQEIISAEWLTNVQGNRTVYSDVYRFTLFLGFGLNKIQSLTQYRSSTNITLPNNSIIYLGTHNVKNDELIINSYKESGYGAPVTIKIDKLFQDKNKVYENGGSEIYSN